MTDLEGKVAILTGAARGLGQATAQSLAGAGLAVSLIDFRDDVEGVAKDLQSRGHRTLAIKADITDQGQIRAAAEKTAQEFGRIDILINNAGVDYTLPIDEMSLDQWDKVLAVNLRAPFIFTKTVMPFMQRQKGGHIINIASTAAKRAWANASAYHASKWGLLGFTHALGVEGRAYNIKATAIVTGGMKTPFLLERFPDIDQTTLQDPKNVAEVILYVLSLPKETSINEILVCPLKETSWP
jgi:NAD(P)-dependent dehydrogenase (short-subunit alcohol dehydrogenase family)